MGLDITTTITGVSAVTSLLQGLNPGPTKASYVVGTDVEYAPYVEFGTVYMAAQPYMRPAAREVDANTGTYIKRANSLEGAVRLAALAVEERAKRKCPVDTGTLRASISAVKQ